MEKINNKPTKYIVGISFKHDSKTLDYDANFMDFRVGDECVAETSWGENIGTVVLAKRNACCKKKIRQYKKVLREATKEDLKKSELNDKREKEAYQFCKEKIKVRKISMKLFQVHMNLDATKAKFYFTAEGRVDFRALIKDLAQKFGMKIEMRQIGVRDEAKLLGGCGPCGNQLCCTGFLKDFEPVSIKMAKNQNLALNPLKITGVCGRLLCCLIYENEMYKELRKNIPKNGTLVNTNAGEGKIIGCDIIQQKVFVELKEGKRDHFHVNEVQMISQPDKKQKPKNHQEKNGKE